MDNSDTKTPVSDAQAPTAESQVDILQNLESLIKSHIANIGRLKTELKKHKEMLDSILENDETYRLHAEKAKEASKIKQATKQQLLKQPNAFDLQTKIKEVRRELNELNDSLSDYLREYQRMSGSSEIESEDGTVMEIVYVPKLVKKSSK